MSDSAPISASDVETCERVLRALTNDRALFLDVDPERGRSLLEWAGRLTQPTQDDQRAILRSKRRRMLAQAREKRRLDVITKARAQQRVMRAVANAEVGLLPPPPSVRDAEVPPDAVPDMGPSELHGELKCYICKAAFRTVHPFYASMCQACGDFNFGKRAPRGDLRGRVALITGARLKIGYHTSLLLLRNGCHVVATTRFPRDAADRYSKEPDFVDFQSRLQIFGLDLRHAPSVELLARYLDSTLNRLDFLINNAAQTVRRPPAFYAHLIASETTPTAALPAPARALLDAHESLSASLSQRAIRSGQPLVDAESVLGAWGGDSAGAGVWASAKLSQLPYAEEEMLGEEMFPAARVDSDRQQVDRRAMNSWRLKAADVPTPELLEVHLVNAIAPFLLNARLKDLMARDRTGDKHIVNVSAMEGIFTRGPKTDRHPHTNMAKAALNMFTRTSAADYLKVGIHMNSVDTGWVTDEDPLPLAQRKERELDFQPPLDVVDGAARIVDPIFSGLATGEHQWGKFLKDYRPAPW